ncbi:hypothetical protein HYPSUDRAFT_672254 [Hypholoma sublateritium FD-334 SS-4]|uniref:CBF1-interacting co-repressor CIR N-terminal domain-containing protein n=1 Tax=Hypholoma sublateritium (strain FD-334 SS-4) TaxID=945553 RepID=A0A0D2NT31_HYPSF|nr:hypothetical protein HYPSUDRAFT_672254 [Hypholoma sublateritium FD-334 SS-4]
MGKLNIAHHKSYHPYRRDNIEKVRKDEEEAKLKEEKEEGRMMLADAEARIDLLRERAGVSEKIEKKKSKRRQDEDDLKYIASTSSIQGAVLPTTNGHINLFEDLELLAKKAPAEMEKGVPLAPSAKDLNPWYSSDRDKIEEEQNEKENEKKKREESRKQAHDPLTSIERQLATRSSSSSSQSKAKYRPPLPSKTIADKPPEVQARLSRESSERERAMELIRRKKREQEVSATPNTTHGEPSGYADVFNRREVEEAHRYRDRRWDGSSRRNDDRSRDQSRRRW